MVPRHEASLTWLPSCPEMPIRCPCPSSFGRLRLRKKRGYIKRGNERILKSRPCFVLGQWEPTEASEG